MTMDEIRRYGKDVLTVEDIAPVLGAHPQWLRQTIKESPQRIGFAFTFSGGRIIIPRIAFIKWMEGREGRNEPEPDGQEQELRPLWEIMNDIANWEMALGMAKQRLRELGIEN